MKQVIYNPTYVEEIPKMEWQTSTPEEQGMDSAQLVKMVNFYKKKNSKNKNIAIDSITIVRNGFIVADIYLNPLFPKDTKHIIHSCTKSILSALIGIAIDKGFIKSVEVRVLDILDDKNIEIKDERIKALTLKDLLTMQTGLSSQDSYLYQWKGLFKMQTTNDWTKYILNLPLEAQPGTRFDYSNMASFLLSAIIKKATKIDTFLFAKIHLFDPLGIDDIQWEKSPQGIDIGWARMWLKPHDMAKIGLLYLQKGKWGERQIISSNWIEESLTAHSYPKKYRYIFTDSGKINYIASGGIWLFTNLARPFSDSYGYQWWLDKSGRYSAVGTNGQFIMVAPKENLVAVFTSKLRGAKSFLPAKMLKKFIIPAIVSNSSIKENIKAQSELASLSKPQSSLAAYHSVGSRPVIEQVISGKTYLLESNPWRNNNLKLVFDASKKYAEFSYNTKEVEQVAYKVGLNNVNRLTVSNGNKYAAIGRWETPNKFIIEYELIGYSNRGKWILTFEGEQILVEEVGVTGTFKYKSI